MIVQCDEIGIGASIRLVLAWADHGDSGAPRLAGRIVGGADVEARPAVGRQRHAILKCQQLGPYAEVVEHGRPAPGSSLIGRVGHVERCDAGSVGCPHQTKNGAVRQERDVLLGEALPLVPELVRALVGQKGDLAEEVPGVALVRGAEELGDGPFL